jgi:hypothetical protein
VTRAASAPARPPVSSHEYFPTVAATTRPALCRRERLRLGDAFPIRSDPSPPTDNLSRKPAPKTCAALAAPAHIDGDEERRAHPMIPRPRSPPSEACRIAFNVPPTRDSAEEERGDPPAAVCETASLPRRLLHRTRCRSIFLSRSATPLHDHSPTGTAACNARSGSARR